MDFGVGSFDGLVGSDTNTAAATTPIGSSCLASLVSSDPEAKQKWYGSRFLKQARSGTNEDDWRSSKLCKTESMLLQQKMSTISPPPPSGLSFTRTDDGQKQPQMLSFSCPKSEAFSVDRSSQNSTSFPFFHLSSSAYNDINTGYINSGSFNGGSMQLGAFTHSQWMELEQQALVYKYMTANVPIPSNLLIPIRKDVESARSSCFPASLMRPNGLRWEAFHLGYSGNTDPEPGRCRRTDGKKWRCSRDAVPDHKYCERHMNRGRHRSRKPVEGQSGHLAAVSTATAMINNAKLTTSTSAVTMVVGPQGGSMSNSLPLQHRQLEDFQTAGLNTSLSRTFLDKENLVTADPLLSTSNKSSPLMNGRNFGCAEGLTGRNVVQHSLHQFMDDLPNKSKSDCSVVSWPRLHLQSDRPQLSISIPMTTADYMSATSSPNNETTTLLPLRLSCKFDPIQMGLGVGSGLNEPKQRQANWIPISWWGTSVGGPLGEVLNNTSNSSSGECKNSSAMNLMTEGWESSPRMESSPTGVLQKSTFCSLSNSSAGSSPRADNTKTSESASLCNDRDSALVQQSS